MKRRISELTFATKERENVHAIGAWIARDLLGRNDGFTLRENAVGGYVMADGTYVEEPSYTLTLINHTDDDIIAHEIARQFEQESVLVVRYNADVQFLPRTAAQSKQV